MLLKPAGHWLQAKPSMYGLTPGVLPLRIDKNKLKQDEGSN